MSASRRRTPALVAALVLLSAGAVVLGTQTASSAAPPDWAGPPAGAGRPESTPNVHHDVSPPLRDLPPAAWNNATLMHEHQKINPAGATLATPDGALQTTAAPSAPTTSGLNFPGVGNGDYSFSPDSAPPDTNGAVGATQYVQWVNESYAVFDKATGALVAGPTRGNTLWYGFGGGCETNNDGDPIVAYDKAAQRWVLTQFSVSSPSRYGYLQCVAVSTTSDATGTYNRYAFSYGGSAFNDYPKLGVWPDGYYIAYNIFTNGQSFAGSKVCSFDRAKMLAGASATQVCFQLSPSYGNLLPSDLDGRTAPPGGATNLFASFAANSLLTWRFHVDFTTPGNSTFTGPVSVPVAAFSEACSGGTCIPQPGTSQKLDSLADRLMYRLAYRNFGDHESWVVNHSVTAGSSVGVRWYELRDTPTTAPTVYQQGTYAPDGSYRWMGSIAMDQSGDIALGYSVSSSTMRPSIAYATRVPTDALGTLGAETSIQHGAGSQTATLERWGDYSSMTVDPVDDCTFWYTTEYLKSSGTFNWSTRIASFKLASCGGTTTPVAPGAPTGLTAKPGNGSVALSWTAPTTGGVPASYDIWRGTTAGGEVFLTPTGSTATTYTDSAGLTNGTTYYYKVAGHNSAGAGTLSNEASATPTAPATPSFTLTASPSSRTVNGGRSASYALTVTSASGFSGAVSLTASPPPSVSAALSPTVVTVPSGGSASATLTASAAASGQFTITVTATSGATSKTVQVSFRRR